MRSKPSTRVLKDMIQWDVKTWSRVLPFWENHVDFKAEQKVLAIGEREGGLSLWLARKGLNVVCSDYKDFPASTEKMHLDYRVNDHIEYHHRVDVTDLSRYSNNSFDLVVFKSVIGVLSKKERQQQALNEMWRILKPGGKLIFAENLVGTKLHVWLRKKFVRWNSYWRYLQFREDKDLFNNFSMKVFKTTGFFANFGRSELQRGFLAAVDKLILWMTPQSWRYVLFGVLVK